MFERVAHDLQRIRSNQPDDYELILKCEADLRRIVELRSKLLAKTHTDDAETETSTLRGQISSVARILDKELRTQPKIRHAIRQALKAAYE